MSLSRKILAASAAALLLAGCATESSRSLEVAAAESYGTPYQGRRIAVSIGNFDNRSGFGRGIFSDGEDRLGSQAKTILATHLQQSGRFHVLNRTELGALKQESAFSGKAQHFKGADYVVTGNVTEFGRKDVGDQQLFGILGRGKSQIAYAKVALNVVDVATSEIVYAAQGAGEYSLSSREIIGFGGTSGYDATLNGKVLDLAVREAVGKLNRALADGSWQAKY